MHWLRPAEERGHANYGWLDTHHTFSFAGYYDPQHVGFGPLRVINDDRVAPGAGFGTHPHQNMEILTYVVEGALEHRDSMGTGSVIRPGEVQRMTAGTGVTHSEFNHSKKDELRFLQIWVLPERRGLRPDYAQRDFSEQRVDRLHLVASPSNDGDALTLHQDLELYASVLSTGRRVRHRLRTDRQVWVQVVDGSLRWQDLTLNAGDGLAVLEEPTLEFEALKTGNFLLFDMPRSAA